MSDFFGTISERYARWVIRWRWLLVIAAVIGAVGVGTGAQHLRFTSDYRVFFSEANPQLTAYDSLQDIYTKTDNIVFVLKPEDGLIMTPKWLDVTQKLTVESWQIPYSIRVDSVTNFQNTVAEGDDLTVADLVEGPLALSKTQLERIISTAQNEPALANRIISPDNKTTAVQVTLQLPPDDMIALNTAVEYAEKMAAKIEAENPSLRVAITGLAPLSNAFPRASMLDMQTLTPIMFGIIVVALIGFLRSFSGTIGTLIVTILSTVTAMGFAGYTGVKLTPPSAMAPTIILTIAIADCVHILVSMFHEMRAGRTKHEAIIESIRINMQPVFLTSFTTIIGFMSLNFSDAPPFNDLGNMAAVGVAAAWLYSILFLPAFMAIIPVRVKKVASDKIEAMDRLGDFVVQNRTKLLLGMGIIAIGMSALISKIELDDRFVEYFDTSIPFRVDSDFARENLSGIYQVEFSVNGEDSGGISDPEYLENLENFAIWLRAQPGVVHVNSLTDVMKRLSKSMHADEESWYRLPEGRELAAQYLLLYELSLPYGLDLNSQINVDKSASRMTVTLDNVTSGEMRGLADRSQQWLRDNAPAHMVAEGSGAAVMFAHIAHRNIQSMLFGTFVAFLVISGSMILALKSLRIGLISLIPNLVPAAMAFGLWGVLYGQIGLASSMVAATTLGLIVDASVHFLSKYVRARRERNATPEEAVRYSFRTVGKALLVTTSVLFLGFAVLSQSSFQVNSDLGLLTAITIAIALVVDFLLLPPLLMLLDRKKSLSTTNLAAPQAAE
ncbi:RND transporter [Alphaproteobacteria bacterium 46_93_T64]|nr:RND transporter [Alphaproteobacteria bacterium 46_93_T64]